jgi:hypothetical protein
MPNTRVAGQTSSYEEEEGINAVKSLCCLALLYELTSYLVLGTFHGGSLVHGQIDKISSNYTAFKMHFRN